MGTSIKRGIAFLLISIMTLSSLNIVGAAEANSKIDILKTYPANNSIISEDLKEITFEFKGDILLNQTNIKEKIEINAYKIDKDIPGLNSDSIDNYDVFIEEGNKLILKRLPDKGNLNEFSYYTVTLKEKVLKLKNNAGKSIYNKEERINFTTNNMVKETFPKNNQGGIDHEKVELEPTITFKFKYPIEILSKNKIKISSDGIEFLLDPNEIKTSGNNQILNISINDIETKDKKKYKLRPNTLYKVTLEKGAVKFKNYNIRNEEDINLYFITEGVGDIPYITQYTSTVGKPMDDITLIDKTELGPDGSIYIHFNEPVRWDKGKKPLTSDVMLYKIHKPTKTEFDYSSKKINETYTYLSDGKTIITENNEKMERIPVSKIEILEEYENIIKITPINQLLSLNQYNLKLSKEFIENYKAYNLDKDIDFYFWTKPSVDKLDAKWETDKMTAEYIKESIISPYKKEYTLYGVPQYTNIIDATDENKENPIVLYAEGELLPKVDNIGALSQITLREVFFDEESKEYKDRSDIGFLRYKLQYYHEKAGSEYIKKTKISLYPSKTLERGKNYRLIINEGTFETRSRHEIEELRLNFVVEGSAKDSVGIYDIEPSRGLKIGDIAQGKQAFKIIGFNFSEKIERIDLIPENDILNKMKKITIWPEDIRFKTITELEVLLRGEVAQQLSKEESIGDYRVRIYFDNSISKKEIDSENSYLTVLPNKTPYIKDIYLTDLWNFQWLIKDGVTTNDLEYSSNYNYLVLKIGHDDDNIELSPNPLDKISLTAEGSTINLVDKSGEEPKLIKDIPQPGILIPIKGLASNTKYLLTIKEGLVQTVNGSSGTEAITGIFFTTRTNPHVHTVFTGSVTEDYDPSEPIYIKGGDFVDTYYDYVTVYFNDIEAQRAKIIKDTSTGEVFLEVYLPRRLRVGTYDITISNGENHSTTLDSAFSVVRLGEYLPNEIESLKDRTKMGDIMSSLTISHDTLLLDSRYSDTRSLELDLDELMGQEVLIRKIKYEAHRNDTLNKLETTSIWANVTLRDIRPEANERRNEIEIMVGRTDPLTVETLKGKLRGANIKSEFISVSGTGYNVSNIELSIPYKDSDGKNLTALRYDEATRRWEEEIFQVDTVENRVNITSYRKGIFVIVETQN
ncbi:hypothetical protein DW1_0174 [Proteiniborus sp. DW1]|uniref:hypothetical protein n=1 Tax=Proteiniborus sp. DW1 TaxID=1889883 RepID=UPI00092E0782|nr:hypothetical protein [Proteiniborus sp. DW1]SCG81795.1 hypothetical protein DW1_0174 [Proteiniborus sp. DW1]